MPTLLSLKPFLYKSPLCVNENSFVLLNGILDLNLLESIEHRNLERFSFPKRIDAKLAVRVLRICFLTLAWGAAKARVFNQMDYFET